MDADGNGSRDGTLSADVEIVSNVYVLASGAFRYAWRITNFGTGSVANFVGANTPQFVISASVPLIGIAGVDRIVGTSDDLQSPQSQTVALDSTVPPHSEAWGIIPNPPSGLIGTLLAPSSDVDKPIAAIASLTPNPALTNSSRTLVAYADDVQTGNSSIAGISFRIDVGSWTAMSSADGGFDEPTETASATLPLAATAGIQEVCVRANDASGNTSEPDCVFSVSYMDAAQLVTGGGGFTSPADACQICGNAPAEAHIGFIAKTNVGSIVPKGTLQLTVGEGLNFHADDYEWLLVDGNQAVLQGTGTINGDGQYKLLLRVLDAGRTGDRLRITIWRSSGDELIYDSEPGASVTGEPNMVLESGSIIVHAKR